jgi:uncharacterized protein
MGKFIFWVVVAFVVLLALRLYNAHQLRKRSRPRPDARSRGEPMVRCTRCGVFLPRSEAREVDGGYQCREGLCVR